MWELIGKSGWLQGKGRGFELDLWTDASGKSEFGELACVLNREILVG